MLPTITINNFVFYRNFIYALASFKKPLIAGVNGKVCGIGVTMLSAFDLVYSSDSASFQTEFAKIGQIPEGATILNLTQRINQSLVGG